MNPKNLNKCCPSKDGNVGNAIACIIKTIKLLERGDSSIENNLDTEHFRALDAENTLQLHINLEYERATTKENELEEALNQEVENRTQDVDAEVLRALTAELALNDKIDLEILNREADVDAEETRAKAAELALSNKIDENIETERNRATNVETTISSDLTDEIEARKQAITNVINSIPNAQILSDWNLTDSNAKDYIKNKPRTLDGKSAYELAVDNGYEGTLQEWLASLKGATGAQGPKGDTGATGAQGILGATGPLGPKGETGATGPLGIQGILGPAGQDGSNGADGHTPIITASKSSGVTTISVDGTAIATINDGSNGSNGTNGTDGITPTVNVTAISNGHKVAFNYGTDDSRNTEFNVIDGNVAGQMLADWNQSDNTLADYIKNKPTIPVAPDLTNYVLKSLTVGLLKNDGTIDTNTYLTAHQSLSGYAKLWVGTQAQYDLLTPDSDTIYIITSAS